jgi:POT family proton-dependent oligopeptide transporter
MATSADAATLPTEGQKETLFGHPVGLYTLFFAEMWERFSYYGMRALLTLYMIKGFLAMNDDASYVVYGAYTSMVYATPFIGGMLADRLLGARRAVVMGGLLMAAGHLMMTVEQAWAFYLALALLIAGNGFFKPNISTMVGQLYAPGSPKRDGGFTIFYMGINLGGALAPLVCGYVGEVYGWHYGFGLATIGMLIGTAIFVAPTRLTQALIIAGALVTSGSLLKFQDNPYSLIVNIFVAAALLCSGVVAFVALGRGGVPREAGAPPVAARGKPVWPVYLGTLVAIPIFMQIVQPTNTLTLGALGTWDLAGLLLIPFGVLAFGWLIFEAIRSKKVERQRMWVVLILTFFSLLFWAFAEQAGSSLNNFTDRNVDRVIEQRTATASDVGTSLEMRVPIQTGDPALAQLPPLTQEQLGYRNGDQPPLTMSALDAMRTRAGAADAGEADKRTRWTVSPDSQGMGVGGSEIPTSQFQAANPIYILIFGLLFTMLWTFLGTRGLEPNTAVKFALGLLQLGLGFGVLWYGASQADARGMVAVSWLLLGYLLQTTGELCLSPVGLSMITKLSPRRLVSTVMGAWFLATAFAQYLAGAIARLTGVGEGEGPQTIPVPKETVHLYGDVFGQIAIIAVISALICFALAPWLHRWMHEEAEPT